MCVCALRTERGHQPGSEIKHLVHEEQGEVATGLHPGGGRPEPLGLPGRLHLQPRKGARAHEAGLGFAEAGKA